MSDVVTVVDTEKVVVTTTTPIQVIETTLSNIVVASGDRGPQGIPGTGSAGSDKYYSQPFTSQSTVAVTHNLGKYPAITVLDSAGDECEGTVLHNSLNDLSVSFSAPFSGIITCN